MDKLEKEVLQITKEIAIKFIEIQRLSPSNFNEIFPSLYETVAKTALNAHKLYAEKAQGASKQ